MYSMRGRVRRGIDLVPVPSSSLLKVTLQGSFEGDKGFTLLYGSRQGIPHVGGIGCKRVRTFFGVKPGLNVVCRAASGVMVVDIFNVFEVFRQVHGYFGGIVYLVHQTHCKKLYSVGYQEPSHAEHVVSCQVSPRWKFEQKPNQFILCCLQLGFQSLGGVTVPDMNSIIKVKPRNSNQWVRRGAQPGAGLDKG